ncbi:hypothetical protein HanRHA438_Chr02g0081091 [Helianthus annuus]|uniref:Ubiquinol-cytochrome c reductase complex 6.7 kDa protein n=1 Tax=Helianthus annuus TaxID=4232 RepID=A0A251VGT5_HELAN|nr:hypothetical protein HanXRQr2_Chr02g0069671 [Helianthus annuus]KAJ0604990.1 hypothetical protein HanHA300_Chr02g0057941 [Helianthus annuus]KAJ0615669.1 hypothetical protein HanIR_Chr02g0081811 [Helianthus annuus]KAJ0619004.1 hypothetical protein HanHA89_Chr02g0066431 [Helianthus annuus]KAJ0777458.1 hypothetical protein HanLR1_Chr02g0060701 [Helianthus annuus]
MAGGAAALKLVKPKNRPQATDIQAAAAWGVAAFTTAVWIVQPFDWVKKTFFEKPAPEN